MALRMVRVWIDVSWISDVPGAERFWCSLGADFMSGRGEKERECQFVKDLFDLVRTWDCLTRV